MRSTRRGEGVKISPRLTYALLLRVNRQLLVEKVELIEEVRQLRAAVEFYREGAALKSREKVPLGALTSASMMSMGSE